MMALMLRQFVASTSSIHIWGSVWGFPSIIEISERKFPKFLLIVSEHAIIQIKKLLFLNISLKKGAANRASPEILTDQ
jgi:hypothetical protein